MSTRGESQRFTFPVSQKKDGIMNEQATFLEAVEIDDPALGRADLNSGQVVVERTRGVRTTPAVAAVDADIEFVPGPDLDDRRRRLGVARCHISRGRDRTGSHRGERRGRDCLQG